MPESAISTGIADHVVPPGRIGELLERYVQDLPMAQPEVTAEDVEPVMSRVFAALKRSTGQDFSFYKMNTVMRRVRRRMNVLDIREPQQYLTYLGEHHQEAALLFRELLIRVTSFFRDPAFTRRSKRRFFRSC